MSASALPTSALVGVVGAGTMGAGIAWVAAEAGHRVRLYDADPSAVDNALFEMRGRLARSVSKGRRTEADVEAMLARIEPAPALADLEGAALVIEAIVENLEIKQQVFAALEQLVPADGILATNTSSLSVTAIAAGRQRPDRIVGMHFFNPAPVMPLVEIVIGAETDSSVASMAHATALAWGKTPVRCTSTPGFIVNRVARPFYAEALRIFDEGVADAATIDAVIKGSGGFRMGPFALMDLVGLDVNLAVSKSVYEQTFHDPRFQPHVRQQAKLDAGHLGRKTKRGWFDYRDDAAPSEIASAPQGRQPDRIRAGEDPRLDGLVARIERAGHSVDRTIDGWWLEVDGVELFPTDGRPAELLMLDPDLPDRIVFDLVLDWDNASRVAIAAPVRVGEASVATAAGLFQTIGCDVIRVADAPGLVMARIVAQLASVAADAAAAGVATPEDIDTAMQLGTNYPGGPFEWADTIGVVQLMMLLDNLRWFYGEDRYRTAASIKPAVYTSQSLREQARRTI